MQDAGFPVCIKCQIIFNMGTTYLLPKKNFTLVKVLVIRDWMLLVVVLKVLQLWAIRRAAKSRKAQWLSTSGRKHSCLLTIQVTTAGMSSWSCRWREKEKRKWISHWKYVLGYKLHKIIQHCICFHHLHIFPDTGWGCPSELWPSASDKSEEPSCFAPRLHAPLKRA